MKKILLNGLMLMGMSLSSFAQFTFTTTSATYTGNGNPATGNGAFYSYQPGYDPGFYVDNACSVVSTTSGANQLGGFDANIQDATTANPSRPGAIFYGGAIRNMYNGTPCTANTPSFGFTFNNNQVVDLSSAANQKIQFTYLNNTGTDLNVVVQLFDKPSYNPKLTTLNYTFLADNTSHTVTIDLSSNIAVSADLSNIAQVSFTYPFDTKSPDFGLSFSNIKIGSAVTSSINAKSSIESSAVYPNPALDMATVKLNLKTTSQLKVTLSDLMGKEVMVITEGTMESLQKDFSVASLNKGIYTVNYFVNGASAGAEMLMVK